VGRRHLSRALPFLIVLAVAASAAAASTVPFRVVAHGISTGTSTAKPFAIVATSRAAAQRIVLKLPAAAQPLLRADYRTSIALGVFGPFGCRDHRVHIARVTQTGRMLTVHLTIKALASGTAECDAVYETARVLVLPRVALTGVPTKAAVVVAGP
jgi:hypothetical protein